MSSNRSQRIRNARANAPQLPAVGELVRIGKTTYRVGKGGNLIKVSKS